MGRGLANLSPIAQRTSALTQLANDIAEEGTGQSMYHDQLVNQITEEDTGEFPRTHVSSLTVAGIIVDVATLTSAASGYYIPDQSSIPVRTGQIDHDLDHPDPNLPF